MKPIMMKFSFFLLFSFSLIFSPFLVLSQEFYFDNYGVREGLADSKVKDIVQSKDGYLWLATESGVCRFDGSEFTNYTTDDGVSPLGVSSLFIDSYGNLWIGHFSGGLTLYRNSKFEKIHLDSITGDITDIVEDSARHIWVSTTNSGVYRIDNPGAKKIKAAIHLKAKDGLANIVYSMVSTKSLGMLFVTRYGVKFYNNKIKKFEFVNEQFFAWPQYFNIIQVFEDNQQGIWLGTFNGGLYYYKDMNTPPKIYDKRDGLAMNWVSDIYQTRDSAVWVATFGGGISVFKNGKIENYNTSNGLPENKVNTLFEDFEGNILIGTYSKGLSVFKGRSFVNYKKFISDKIVQVNAVAKDHLSSLWFATNEGLFHYFKGTNNRYQFQNFKEDDIDLQSNDIRNIKIDAKGNVWLGTWGGGLSVYEVNKKKMIFPFLPNELISQANRVANVTALEFDKEGDLWIGTNGGLIYFEPQNNKVDILSQGNGLQNNDIASLYCDDNGVMWVGHQDKGITRISGSTISKYSLGLTITPTCFYGDDKGLWIGSQGMGLYFVKNHKVQKHFTINTGLLSNLITALALDERGGLLVGTNRGLNHIDFTDSTIASYGLKEGFVGVEVKPNSFFKEKDGNIWCGTALGVTHIFTKYLKVNEKPPIININRLRVNLEDVPIVQGEKFNYSHNSVLIDYKAICISDASKVEYKVRLLGVEKEWQPITKQTYANFPALPAGDYTFEVIARNNAGIWNPEPKKLSFIILAPFWQTYWFFALVLTFVIIVVVLYVKIREKKLLHEKAELEQKVQERTLEVRNKNQLLAKKNKDITDSINYARRIQRAIMPPQNMMNKLLKSSFIYYRPKDIVSGDFHWNTYHNGRLIIAAADCTGHGVPGAFMSMISISSLNKVVKEKQLVDPARILDNMRFDIVNDLKQSGDLQPKDGLDIALLSIEVEKRLVHYAGAYNSMYIVKAKAFEKELLDFDFNYSVYKNRLIEVKANRMPIGISDRMNLNFTTKSIQLEEGDRIYITTDGYIDQFGGEKGKKFMSKRFKELLLSLPYDNSTKSLDILDNQFITWRGKHEQIDDVLVIGICF